ncbi:hypothetical protein V1L54_11175 [Streptomyces sp. TRM 70361]|uniref:hypothetical protein n=1 Tax=Streptomyces sp. TRM 70361 TaxID=3116553 RepID=UPI002E7B888D|nr:hypothetical protein [Streptomyces sp. TRM 70361]MEE1939962.1 hypothetical protein [Streptomyces sp. TRM 70361]
MSGQDDTRRTGEAPAGPSRPEDRGRGTGEPEPRRSPLEEDPAVRRAFTDDNTATALTTEDEDDRGPLAPRFQEPGDS